MLGRQNAITQAGIKVVVLCEADPELTLYLLEQWNIYICKRLSKKQRTHPYSRSYMITSQYEVDSAFCFALSFNTVVQWAVFFKIITHELLISIHFYLTSLNYLTMWLQARVHVLIIILTTHLRITLNIYLMEMSSRVLCNTLTSNRDFNPMQQ